MPKPIIDAKKCTVCGTCVDTCPVNVFEKKEDKIEIAKPDDCIGCRACEAACPVQAINVED
jgi:NAD-dependent dihydropyrimidine dehydrogenase PreA subunit